jgi:pimeloyl-ACP methyl ester carboxylesterase
VRIHSPPISRSTPGICPDTGDPRSRPSIRSTSAHRRRRSLALLKHWELADPHVVAHDFGGAVSLRTHLVLGAPYRSLTLVDVVAIPPSGSPFFRFGQGHPTVLAELPGFIHEAIVRAYILGASHRGLSDAQIDPLLRPWLASKRQPAFYRQIADYGEIFLEDNERRLPGLTIRVRVLWGAEDAWIPVNTGRRLAELISSSSFQLIDRAGHTAQTRFVDGYLALRQETGSKTLSIYAGAAHGMMFQDAQRFAVQATRFASS